MSVLANLDLGRMGVPQKLGPFVRELNTLAQMTEKLKANPEDTEALASPGTASCHKNSYKIPAVAVLPSHLP